MTYESAELKFVIAPITTTNLILMLENKITMVAAFREAGYIYISEEDDDDEDALVLHGHAAQSFPEHMLPMDGEYYELDFPWVTAYIDSLKNESGEAFKFIVNYSVSVGTRRQTRYSVSYDTGRMGKPIYEHFVKNGGTFKLPYRIDAGDAQTYHSFFSDNHVA